MNNISIDIGNTETKLGVFEGDNLLKVVRESKITVKWLEGFLKDYSIDKVVVSDVTGKNNQVVNFLEKNRETIIFNRNMQFSIKNFYQTPETLGMDRMANALAAWKLYPNRNTMIIDLGTCLKFDFVSEQGAYLGGIISPGIDLRLRSLHEFTGRLPLVKFKKIKYPIGNSTLKSINAGVYFGLRNEIMGMINYVKEFFDSPIILGTGGGMNNFDIQFKSYIFVQYLTLKGLNSVLTICDEEK